MTRSSAIRQQLVLWGLIVALWGLLVLAFAGQLMLTNSVPWVNALRLSLRDWFPWAFLAPATAFLAYRFPLERPRLHLSIPVHILACMAVVLCSESMVSPPPRPPRGQEDPSRPAERPEEERPPRPFGPGETPPGSPRQGPPPSVGRRAMFMDALATHAKFNIPIYWVVVSIVQALTFYRRSQERERTALELEARLTDAKLQALRAQLHPHFLFNTLNAVSTLVHKDPQAADEMIANLSELLRATLEAADQEIPLRRELDFLDRYLEIQQIRFGNRLRVEKAIQAEAMDGRVPTLILQPLVENSIRHGIEPRTEPGVISISARRRGETLELSVRDNGGGASPSGKSGGGIGLSNTRARLQALYGPDARLTAQSPPEGGFLVEITLPCRCDPPPRAKAT